MSIFTDYLTGIADAIRTKKGSAEPIPAAAFANEISTLALTTVDGTDLIQTSFRERTPALGSDSEFGYILTSIPKPV